jgi:hypothetical protein
MSIPKEIVAMLRANGIEIASFDAMTASIRLRRPTAGAVIKADAKLEARLAEIAAASQWGLNITGTNKQDNFNYRTSADVLPKPEDYITVDFRAISKTIVPGHWIDWSKGSVLKDSLQKLLNQTVYPNHDFTDINNWLGAVSAVEWDEAGEQAENVPGINATYKIDALMNPRIARGLLMKPPAIHSTSMTVLFRFEYSHPEIAAENRWRFFELLGEEVEGEIVRLVVTEILEYWEASLVFQGADRLAKQRKDDEEDFADLSAKPAAGPNPPPNSNEEKTMKLTAEKKAELGIEFDGDDVPETEILKAAESLAARSNELTAKVSQFDQVKFEELSAKAAAGDKLVEEKRADVVRLAKIAELGAEEGDLDPAIADTIKEAGVEKLQQLGTYYQKKAADKFPTKGRSSLENDKEIDAAGGAGDKSQEEELPEAGLL